VTIGLELAPGSCSQTCHSGHPINSIKVPWAAAANLATNNDNCLKISIKMCCKIQTALNYEKFIVEFLSPRYATR